MNKRKKYLKMKFSTIKNSAEFFDEDFCKITAMDSWGIYLKSGCNVPLKYKRLYRLKRKERQKQLLEKFCPEFPLENIENINLPFAFRLKLFCLQHNKPKKLYKLFFRKYWSLYQEDTITPKDYCIPKQIYNIKVLKNLLDRA